jgi:hypothetical protein
MPTTHVNGRTAMSGISATDHHAVTADGVTLALARYVGTVKHNVPVLLTHGLFSNRQVCAPLAPGRLSHGCSRCLALQHLEPRHRDAGDRSVQSAAVFCRAAAAFRSMSGSAGCGWNGGLSGHTPDFARPHQHLERPHAGDGILPSHWQGSCLVPANGVDEVPRMKRIHGGLSRRGP